MSAHRDSLRRINPRFLLSSGGAPKTRIARRTALLAQMAVCRQALALAEYYAGDLQLPDAAQQLTLARELIEATHIAVRRTQL